jgi:hypothetical protein
MLYEKQLNDDIHVVQHTYYAAPQTTLNAGVQDAAHQALTALCQENWGSSSMGEDSGAKNPSITSSELCPEGCHLKLVRENTENW